MVARSKRDIGVLSNSPVIGPNGELAYIIHRVEDVTTMVNLAASALLGHAQRDLLGRKLWTLIKPRSQRDRQISPDTGTTETTAPFDVVEQELLHQDGRLIPVQLHARSIRNSAGEVTGKRVAMIDITARQIAEQNAKKYALELALKNEHLEHALERAKQASASQVNSWPECHMSSELRSIASSASAS